MSRVAAAIVLLLLLPSCQDNTTTAVPKEALVVISAPVSSSPWVGRFLERGAKLAGVRSKRVRVELRDNAGRPQRAVSIARGAIAQGAVALITDGVGARAVAEITGPAHLAVFIAFEGGASLIDPMNAPTLFRMAPANKYLCRRLADYLADTRPDKRVAIITDDSTYGREGAAATKADLLHNDLQVVYEKAVPEQARDVTVQVLAARRSGATTLIVWARALVVAATLRAARANEWPAPVYAGPTGADPLVRQRLADHPEWVDGLTFVSFRITSEAGPQPFADYRTAYEKAWGVERIGVVADGREVVVPPDWSTYAYDSVNLVDAAIAHAGAATAVEVLTALQEVSITGANGDERGFGPDDREGVSPDDMYFARFSDMRFAPVKDDKLSTNLPVVPQ